MSRCVDCGSDDTAVPCCEFTVKQRLAEQRVIRAAERWLRSVDGMSQDDYERDCEALNLAVRALWEARGAK